MTKRERGRTQRAARALGLALAALLLLSAGGCGVYSLRVFAVPLSGDEVLLVVAARPLEQEDAKFYLYTSSIESPSFWEGGRPRAGWPVAVAGRVPAGKAESAAAPPDAWVFHETSVSIFTREDGEIRWRPRKLTIDDPRAAGFRPETACARGDEYWIFGRNGKGEFQACVWGKAALPAGKGQAPAAAAPIPGAGRETGGEEGWILDPLAAPEEGPRISPRRGARSMHATSDGERIWVFWVERAEKDYRLAGWVREANWARDGFQWRQIANPLPLERITYAVAARPRVGSAAGEVRCVYSESKPGGRLGRRRVLREAVLDEDGLWREGVELPDSDETLPFGISSLALLALPVPPHVAEALEEDAAGGGAEATEPETSEYEDDLYPGEYRESYATHLCFRGRVNKIEILQHTSDGYWVQLEALEVPMGLPGEWTLVAGLAVAIALVFTGYATMLARKRRLVRSVGYLPAAPMFRRLGAYLADRVIFAPVWWWGWAYAWPRLRLRLIDDAKWMAPWFALAIVAGFFIIYASLMEGRYGATLGKRLFRLRIVTSEGDPITPSQAWARNVMRLFDEVFCLVPLLGPLVAVATRQDQRIGDLLAGTIVAHEDDLPFFGGLDL